MDVRPVRPDDVSWMHALNQDHATELAPMTLAAFAGLVSLCTKAWAVDPEAGFLLVMDHTVDYDSPNFLWFRAQADRFMYVDRIVVAPQYRRVGLARTFYQALFEFAQSQNVDRVYCEVNETPPNPRSDAFHAALGFRRIGDARLEDRGKTVQYLERRL